MEIIYKITFFIMALLLNNINSIFAMFIFMSYAWCRSQHGKRMQRVFMEEENPAGLWFPLGNSAPVVRAASLDRASGVIRRGEHTVARFSSRVFIKKTLLAGWTRISFQWYALILLSKTFVFTLKSTKN